MIINDYKFKSSSFNSHKWIIKDETVIDFSESNDTYRYVRDKCKIYFFHYVGDNIYNMKMDIIYYPLKDFEFYQITWDLFDNDILSCDEIIIKNIIHYTCNEYIIKNIIE